MGTIFNKHTGTPLEELGLNYQQIRTLDNRLNQHAISMQRNLFELDMLFNIGSVVGVLVWVLLHASS